MHTGCSTVSKLTSCRLCCVVDSVASNTSEGVSSRGPGEADDCGDVVVWWGRRGTCVVGIVLEAGVKAIAATLAARASIGGCTARDDDMRTVFHFRHRNS